MLKNNEFFIANNILNIDGLIYRVRKDNKLTVWKYGGSLTGYYSSFKIHTSRSESFLRIPKFFKNIEQLELIDVDNKTTINPIETIEYDNFVHFEFLNKKNVVANIHARII
jgi:hypothetical protein